MATKQTRRSISVRGTTYDKLRVYSEGHDRSMSEIVEELLATILEKDDVVALRPPAPPKPRSESRLRFNPPPIMREKRPSLANRVVRAVPPPMPVRPISNRPSLPGRPAPTPAAAVTGTQRASASTKDDYRTVKF